MTVEVLEILGELNKKYPNGSMPMPLDLFSKLLECAFPESLLRILRMLTFYAVEKEVTVEQMAKVIYVLAPNFYEVYFGVIEKECKRIAEGLN